MSLRYLRERLPGCEAFQISAVGQKDCLTPDGIRVCPALQFLKLLVVCDVPNQLGRALAEARECHARYLPQQRQAFAYTFHHAAGSTAAERGADAIARFLSVTYGK